MFIIRNILPSILCAFHWKDASMDFRSNVYSWLKQSLIDFVRKIETDLHSSEVRDNRNWTEIIGMEVNR